MLTENDKPPNCPGLPGTVNLALELLFEIPIVWYPVLRDLWYEPTCNYDARKDAQIIIDIAPLSKIIVSYYYVDAEFCVLLYGCDNSWLLD
jgi:hypothetical protein